MEPHDYENIEHMLGRPLNADELVKVPTTADLTPAHKAVVAILAPRQLVLCALYLREVCTLGVGEATRYIDEVLTAKGRYR